ncbi:hypothetical protein ACKI18_47475, partial [Streptomyces niveiscabiei]
MTEIKSVLASRQANAAGNSAPAGGTPKIAHEMSGFLADFAGDFALRPARIPVGRRSHGAISST